MDPSTLKTIYKKEKMVSRVERCSGCGRPLQLPPQADAGRCSACQAVTRFGSPSDRWATANGMVFHAPRGRFQQNLLHNFVPPAPGNGMMYPRPGYNNYYMDYPQPQPQLQPRPRPWPAFAPPPFYGRKKALLCGITYNNTNYKLSGSVNDVKRMRFLLVDKLGFPMDSVVILTEEEKNPFRIPTKHNIRTAMRWLVQDCQPGDSLVFQYSGHGNVQKDYNGDELDGFDETLCPLDHETEGPIIDDEINATIVRPLPPGAKLHAIFDSGHSGTLLDLPFVCKMSSDGFFKWEDQRLPTACYKGTSGGIALSFSACADNQISARTSAFTGRYATGCITSSFIQAVGNEPGLTYGRLFTAMRYAIASLIQDATGVFQEPQLSASETFDVHSKQVIL